MWHIIAGHAAIYSPPTNISQKIRGTAGSTRGDEHFAVNVVDCLGEGVRKTEQQPIGEPAFKSGLQRVVNRIATVSTRLDRTEVGMNTWPAGHEDITRIQLFVYEEVNAARSNISRVNASNIRIVEAITYLSFPIC